MNILIYATTFGADLLSFARYASQVRGDDVRVIVKGADRFRQEAIVRHWNLDLELVEKRRVHLIRGIRGFVPDVTVMDNHLPMRRLSEKGLILWHGYGWKGPNDVHEFRWLHRNLNTTWGSVREPNPNLWWNCFGPVDVVHRTKVSGVHPENAVQFGAVSHDDLRVPVSREVLQQYYPFDVTGRKTVLIAPTWHYGEVFSHWGGDEVCFSRLLGELERRGVNVILRLHDSFRFDAAYLETLRALERAHGHLILKFKDHHPDNFLDMQVSDLLITNFSSIANLFYATGKPTLHVYPVKDADEEFMWKQQTILGVKERRVESARFIWKYDPEDHGGLLARSMDELMEQLAMALEDGSVGRAEAESYLERHMGGVDGRNGERLRDALGAWLAG